MSRSTFLISAVSLAALLLLAGCNGSDNSTGNTALPTGSKPDTSKPDTSVPDPTQPDKGKKYAKQQVTQGDTFSYQYTLKPGQTLRVIQPATLGNVSAANGLVIYQAPLALTGTDQFKLEVIDGLSALSLDWMIRVNKPTPRFSVVAVNDQVAAKAWQCVSDAETHQGVTWLTAIHPNTETFSWQNWEATLPGFAADCSLSGALSGKACTTNNLIDYANQQQWCGKTDWRLPYAYEMQNLTSEQDFALDRNQAAIDPFFFPHVGFETYWLKNDASAQQADNIAYRYSFGANRKKSLSQNKRKPASVILVSGSYRDPSLPNQQIKPQAEETSFIRLDNAGQPLARNRQQDDYQDSPWRCLDDMRGLVRDNLYLRDKRFSYVYWLIPNSSDATSTLRNYVSDSSVSNCAQTECSIEAALQVINRSKQCGRSDWRLPTADELALLMHQQVSGGEYKLLYSKSLNSPVAGDYWVATSTETGHGTLKLPMTATLQPTPLTAQNKATQTAKLLLIASEFEPRATEDPRSVRNHTKPDITRLRQAYATHPYHWPAPFVDDIGSYQELGTMPHPVFPNHNPYDEKKVALGKKLFFDPFLSQAQDVACASCHEPKKGWGDGREVSIGHDRQRGKRNAPTIVNSAFLPQLFWDGRAATLEQQALMPIQDPLEMAESLPNLVKRLNAHPNYPTLFDEVFGQGRLLKNN
ncbi:cytochrome c peroxidase [Photobacterium swingsii]|uniref:cytochrome c peroxidase n=1 Tax=Photobacterium swingsii TaxID=680026 RepID=UPI000A410748|nr:cytochrome c peroxidase [Photobacterium swingsii]